MPFQLLTGFVSCCSMLARAAAAQLGKEEQAALGFLIQVSALRLASASDAGQALSLMPAALTNAMLAMSCHGMLQVRSKGHRSR